MRLHRQHEGGEPLVFSRTKTVNHVALQLRELVGVKLVVLGKLFGRLFKDDFV